MNAILQAHRQLSRFDGALSDWGASLASLALRWYIGWQFFKAGLAKIRDWDATLALFQDTAGGVAAVEKKRRQDEIIGRGAAAA